MTPFLEVKDMRKSYGAIKAVDGVTLSVAPGEIVGVIGPNGSARRRCSTALGQTPTGGAVEFCGEHHRRRRSSLAPRRRAHVQTPQVFVGPSVRDT
jgi:branched-chain amino acid transport system ATP-binding protein